MLNYGLFCKVMAERIKDFLPENLKDCDVSVEKVQKCNTDTDGLRVIEKGKVFGKCFNLDGLYSMYKHSQSDMTDFLKETADLIAENMSGKKQTENNIEESYLQMKNADKEAFLGKVFFTLENKAQNMSKNQNMPARDYLDCQIVYKYLMTMNDNEMASMAVDNGMMQAYGVTEQELYDAAYKNSRSFFPANVTTMADMMSDMMIKDGVPEDIVKMMYGDSSFENSLWIISNDRGVNGSVNIIYDDILSELSQKIGGDLCIFLSSVHECIAVRDDGTTDYEDFAGMVNDINMCAVDIRDRLSNQVYKYDSKKHELTQKTDTKFKRVDGKEMSVHDAAKKINGSVVRL